MRVLVVLLLLARPADAAPWGERCRDRLAKVAETFGKATITLTPATSTGTSGEGDRFGELKIVVGRFAVSAGEDKSGHRYRGRFGMEDKKYEVWHSPFDDSLNGDPPKPPERATFIEFHHRLALGILRGEIVVEGKPHPDATNFVAAMKQKIAECFTDITDLEGDPTLPWTTECAKGLQAAQAALAKADPFFNDIKKCARDTFGAMCGRIDGEEPHWNATTSIGALEREPKGWFVVGTNRETYGADEYRTHALIWAGEKMPAARFKALSKAFRPALEKCTQLIRGAMRR